MELQEGLKTKDMFSYVQPSMDQELVFFEIGFMRGFFPLHSFDDELPKTGGSLRPQNRMLAKQAFEKT